MNYETTSNWLSLPLYTSNGSTQLLAKFVFISGGYTIYATDLCHVWSECATTQQVLDRAEKEQTSIDPSEDDAQLDILLQKIESALRGASSTSLSIVQEAAQLLTIAIKVSLPHPLQPLEWTVRLGLMPEDAVTFEFILPLLKTTYEKQKQEEELIKHIAEKDNVISKILDKVESLGMDLSSIFPNTGVPKAGRRGSRRETVAKHVRGLAVFDRQKWQEGFNSSRNETPIIDLIRNVFGSSQYPDGLDSVKMSNGGSSRSTTTLPAQEPKNQGVVSTLKQEVYSYENAPHDEENTTTDDEFQEAVAPVASKDSVLDAGNATETPTSISKIQKTDDKSPHKKKLGRVGGTALVPPSTETEAEAQMESPNAKTGSSEDHDLSFEHTVKPRPAKLGRIGGPKRMQKDELGRQEGSPSPNPGSTKVSTPDPLTEGPKPRRLGKIGGIRKAAKGDSPETSRPPSPTEHAHSEEDAKQAPENIHVVPKVSPRKLGRIGGRATGTSQSQHETSTPDEPASSVSNSATQENVETKRSADVLAKSEPEKSPAPAESTEQKANRKREELKRTLESGGTAVHKKKRRF